MTYFVFYIKNYRTALVWLLFYDATFELTTIARLFNPISYAFFCIAILLMIFAGIRFKQWYIAVGTWSILAMLNYFFYSEFDYQILWAITLIWSST